MLASRAKELWVVQDKWKVRAGVPPSALDEVDSADLLARAGVAAPDRQRLLKLGRGHPLALALLAEPA